MQKLLIATTNKGKLLEIQEYLGELPLKFLSLKDVGITQEVAEDGKTYEENSQKKAVFYAKLSGLPAVSDDGGVEIDALGGAPGIDSKFFGGKDGKDEDIIAKMKEVAEQLPEDNRHARFVASLSFALPNGNVWSVEDATDLLVAKKPLLKLLKGFPYRSFLIVPQINKYYHESELTEDERKEYNHRYKALQKLKEIIKKELHI